MDANLAGNIVTPPEPLQPVTPFEEEPAEPEVKEEPDAEIKEAIELPNVGAGVDLNLVGADDIEEPDIEDIPEPAPIAAPPTRAGPVHECGLPLILMNKAKLVEYLQRHHIKQKHRKDMEYTVMERRLYEVYVGARRNQRVTKGHFVAALRLWKHGYALNPAEQLDINSIKIGE
jgi:hypothetical protein